MCWIIFILFALCVAYVTMRVMLKMKGSTAALERFELPEDSDKDFFVDPKTGKHYDTEAYNAYLHAMVQNMTDQQLNRLVGQYGGRDNIWNEKMCEAIRTEQTARAEKAAREEEENEVVEEKINADIAPFFWVEQSTGASVGLSCGEYLQEQFESHGMDGSGSDWDRLAKAFVNDDTDLRGKLQFDSQADMFCVYARDAAAVKKFAYAFRAACEDGEKVQKLFNHLTEQQD